MDFLTSQNLKDKTVTEADLTDELAAKVNAGNGAASSKADTDGSNATGTWPISVTGSAASATEADHAASADTAISLTGTLEPSRLAEGNRTCHAYGDSITYGTGASDAAHAYASLVAAGAGLTLDNQGDPGTQILQQAYQFFITDVQPGDVSTVLTGYNDARYVGDAALQLSTYRNALAACLAWASMPTGSVTQGQSADVATAGGVGTYAGYTGTMVRTLTTQNATATASAYGSTVYVCLIKKNDAPGVTYSVAVDGVTVASGAADDIVTTNTVSPRTWGPALIRIPNLANGKHTVVVTKTDAGANPLMIGWFAGNGGVSQRPPTVYVGNCLGMTPEGYALTGIDHSSDAVVAEYNALITGIVRDLQRDGLRVRLVDANRAFNPFAMLTLPADSHPNDAGHAAIAEAFLAEMSPFRVSAPPFADTDAAHVSGTFASVASAGTVRGNTAAGKTTAAGVVGVASADGTGGYFTSDAFVGVNGVSTSNSGVRGISGSGNGGYFTSTSGYGMQATSGTSYGVYSESTSGIALYGKSASSTGVYGSTGTGMAGRFDQTGASTTNQVLYANRSAASTGTGPVVKITDASGATSSSGDLIYAESKQSSASAVRFRVTKTGDVVVNDATAGVVLKSANAHYWRLAVSDAGALSATDLGLTAP